MDFTGERFLPDIEGDIRLEHLHRYLIVQKLVRGKLVLDLACGEGYGTRLLAETASEVIGIDIDAACIAHAQKTYPRSNIKFLQGEAVALPLPDGGVDLVVSFETIEHVVDQRSMMLEIKRVLAPGGVLVLSSPDRREYSDIAENHNPYHLRELYVSELSALLSEHFLGQALYGQRVHYASVVAPIEARKAHFVGFREDKSGGIIPGTGLPAPAYILAVASDGSLPELPAGIYCPASPPYMRDISRLTEELEANTRVTADKDQNLAALRCELDQRGHRVEQLKTSLIEMSEQGALDAERLKLELIQRAERIQGLEARLSGAATEAEFELASLQSELAQRGQRVDELATLLGSSIVEKQALEKELVALQISVSWRLTSPFRSLAYMLRIAKRYGYYAAARLAHTVYRRLPIPFAAEQRLKNFLFRYISVIFARTGAFARWKNSKENVPAPNRPLSRPVQAISAPICDADGIWEWENLPSVRQRIADVLSERRASYSHIKRSIFDIGKESVALAAAQISLPPAGDTPDVSIVIPVFNQLAYTIECLLSIAAAGGDISFEVIVANDCSTDETSRVLEGVSNLKLINQSSNLGFLRNCNSAVEHALASRLVLLNSDTQVSPGWLSGLMRALDEPGIGAVGPKLVYPNGALQEAGVRIRRGGTAEMLGLNDQPDSPRWSYRRDVDYVSGACIMLETDLFRELKGFTEELAPGYCEDLELCLRIRERGLRVIFTPEAEVVHHLSKSHNAIAHTYKHELILRNMQILAERHQATFDNLDDVRTIAMYLPQYHVVAENNLWWGPGFTEWSNVGKARPNFVGHDQPRVPADLGYYDLQVPRVMQEQWDMAARYGIDGFCYYYYWFEGHRLLDQPLDRLLDPGAAHPFCLCWANENWTRRWDGLDKEVLMTQRHSVEDDIAVICDLARYMRHEAYIRVGGKPVLLIYRVDLFPDFVSTAQRWREEADRLGVGEIYLVMVESFEFAGASVAPSRYGCDAAVEFPIHYVKEFHPPSGAIVNPNFQGLCAPYDDVALYYATRPHPGFKRFRTVVPRFDNTPRRQDDGFLLENATPGAFQAWTETAIAETKRDLQGDERLLFINAWNEWGEGCYLEPDRRFGHAFLEAVRNARDAEYLVQSVSVAT